MKLKAICVFIALGLSLIYSHITLDPALLPKFLALATLILGFSLAHLINKEDNTTFSFKTPLFIPYAGYLFFTLLSGITARVFSEWLFGSVKVALELSFFVILIKVLSREKQKGIDQISLSVTLFAFIISIIGLYQSLTFHQTQTGWDIQGDAYYYTSTLGHKNLFSTALFLCLPFAIHTLVIGNKTKRAFTVITLALSLYLLVILETRSVWMAAILAFITTTSVFSWFFFSKKYYLQIKKQRLVLYMGIFIFLISTTAVLVGIKVNKDPLFKDKISTIFSIQQIKTNPKLETYYFRAKMWRKTLLMAKDHPVFGVGAGNWQVYFPEYGLGNMEIETAGGTKHYQRPHNDFLWVLSEIGPGGLICYLLLFILPLILLINTIRKSKNLLFAYLLFFTICGYGFISFFDFPKERIDLSIIFCTLLAVTYTLEEKETDKNKQTNTYLLNIAGLLISILAFITAIYRIKGDQHTAKMYVARETGSYNRMEKEAHLAQSIFYSLDPYSAPLVWYEGVALYSEGDIDKALRDFKNAYALHPNHVHVLNNLASCYVKVNKLDSAIKLYQKAIYIAPAFYDPYYNLCSVYFNTRKRDLAEALFLKIPVIYYDTRYKQYAKVFITAYIQQIIKETPRLAVPLTKLASEDKELECFLQQDLYKNNPLKNAITEYGLSKIR